MNIANDVEGAVAEGLDEGIDSLRSFGGHDQPDLRLESKDSKNVIAKA